MTLTPAEKILLVDVLKKLEPGFLPYEIFKQVARVVTLPIVEFVPLRLNSQNEVEVLLLERSEDDDIWPGSVHVPGTVLRASDKKIEQAFQRITANELAHTAVSPPHFVGNVLHDSKRGSEQAQVYWVEVSGREKVGKFYEAKNLPDNLIDSQRAFILRAVDSFQATI